VRNALTNASSSNKPVAGIHKGKPFVLVMVITICGKHNGAKFINGEIL